MCEFQKRVKWYVCLTEIMFAIAGVCSKARRLRVQNGVGRYYGHSHFRRRLVLDCSNVF